MERLMLMFHGVKNSLLESGMDGARAAAKACFRFAGDVLSSTSPSLASSWSHGCGLPASLSHLAYRGQRRRQNRPDSNAATFHTRVFMSNSLVSRRLAMHGDTLLDTRSVIIFRQCYSGTWAFLMVHEHISKRLDLILDTHEFCSGQFFLLTMCAFLAPDALHFIVNNTCDARTVCGSSSKKLLDGYHLSI